MPVLSPDRERPRSFCARYIPCGAWHSQALSLVARSTEENGELRRKALAVGRSKKWVPRQYLLTNPSDKRVSLQRLGCEDMDSSLGASWDLLPKPKLPPEPYEVPSLVDLLLAELARHRARTKPLVLSRFCFICTHQALTNILFRHCQPRRVCCGRCGSRFVQARC